ncbi:N-acetyltransferase [Devosia yakushimensis]|uniref:N-acetyltransferase n=1 Tax=Devosia yakushimensis TaxID=470028 RepID=A0ABQ5U8J3_9HYPH|nr:GNAT family N-acetyltransferase [Devosia yakushimensis]GLQ08243.1 N-acetyltransferase [Devosia yakushimensis]
MAVSIRPFLARDIEKILATDGGPAWKRWPEPWHDIVRQRDEGLRTVLIAADDGEVTGYGSLIWQSRYARFRDADVPEISDLVIAQSRRGERIGALLLQALEAEAIRAGKAVVGIGVGLYADYGAAQRLYVSQGYVPDGHGITYDYADIAPGASVLLDDDLILWMLKRLE